MCFHWRYVLNFTVTNYNSHYSTFQYSTLGCTHLTWADGTCWMKKNTVSKNDAFEINDKSVVCGIVDSKVETTRGEFGRHIYFTKFNWQFEMVNWFKIKEWKKADITNYESYPDSDECINHNGCLWSGYFSFVNVKQAESWVKANNIIALHSKYSSKYMCADSDCNGCLQKIANGNALNVNYRWTLFLFE